MSGSDLQPLAYVLAVHDLAGSTAYFQNVLGFTVEWHDQDRWQALRRGQVRVHLGRCPDALPPADLGDHNYFGMILTGDVDRLHAEIADRGAIILSPPTDQPWGLREMAVATPEGHRMMFAQEGAVRPTATCLRWTRPSPPRLSASWRAPATPPVRRSGRPSSGLGS